MITPTNIHSGQTFTVPEAGTLVGMLISTDVGAQIQVSLNGTLIGFSSSLTNSAIVYVPLKIPLKSGDKIGTNSDTYATLYFS